MVGMPVAIYFTPQLINQALGTDNSMLTVTSQSMWPLLTRGDLIFIRKTTPEEIKVGTVIVFHHGAGIAVHRIVEIAGQTITTKGDANTATDSPITYDDVVGRVITIGNQIFKVPFVGNIAFIMNPETTVSQQGEPAPGTGGLLGAIARLLSNPLGFCLIVLLPAVLFVSSIWGDITSRLGSGGRKARLRKRVQRLEKRWGQARAKRALGL